MNIKLTTERLYLREFTTDDAQLLVDLNSNPNVTRYTGDGQVDIAQAKEILTDVIFPQCKNNIGRWAVCLKDTNEFVGWCGVKYIEQLNETDLGYRFFEKHWGKGYATESAEAVMDHALNVLKLKNLVGRADLENTVSRKVLEKVGMKFSEECFEHGSKVAKYKYEL